MVRRYRYIEKGTHRFSALIGLLALVVGLLALSQIYEVYDLGVNWYLYAAIGSAVAGLLLFLSKAKSERGVLRPG